MLQVFQEDPLNLNKFFNINNIAQQLVGIFMYTDFDHYRGVAVLYI